MKVDLGLEEEGILGLAHNEEKPGGHATLEATATAISGEWYG